MNTPSAAPFRYQIVFRTECGNALAGILHDAVIESRHGHTRVVATVRDQSEFYGLLDRFAELALHPVSLVELGPSQMSRICRTRWEQLTRKERQSSSTAGDLARRRGP